MNITLLGTGSPTPSLKRMSSGYLIRTGSDVIVFDHGAGAYHRLLETGTPITDVSHLFFSHLHFDHCLDYARLVLTRWDQGAGSIPELKVYGPDYTSRMTKLLFKENGVFHPDLTARTEAKGSQAVFAARGGNLPRRWPNPDVREIHDGQIIEGDGWTLTVRTVIHQQPYLECFAFRLETPEGSLVYSGDTGPCPAMEELAGGCDVLIHMCYRISGTALNEEMDRGSSGHIEMAMLAQKAGVGTLVMTHLTEQMDIPGVREKLIQDIGAIFTGNLIWGEDLMEIPLSPAKPGALL